MSRAYRIRVSETVKRVLRATDGVSTQLEILEILPQEQMAELLEQELAGRGYQKEGEMLVRRESGVTVAIDPKTGTVTVQAATEQCWEKEGERDGTYYDDRSKKDAADRTRQELKADLNRQADRDTEKLQQEVTTKLEKQLGDLRQELDQIGNRVTGEALKRKAASLGQIKEITEDAQSGSLTIVVEV